MITKKTNQKLIFLLQIYSHILAEIEIEIIHVILKAKRWKKW